MSESTRKGVFRQVGSVCLSRLNKSLNTAIQVFTLALVTISVAVGAGAFLWEVLDQPALAVVAVVVPLSVIALVFAAELLRWLTPRIGRLILALAWRLHHALHRNSIDGASTRWRRPSTAYGVLFAASVLTIVVVLIVGVLTAWIQTGEGVSRTVRDPQAWTLLSNSDDALSVVRDEARPQYRAYAEPVFAGLPLDRATRESAVDSEAYGAVMIHSSSNGKDTHRISVAFENWGEGPPCFASHRHPEVATYEYDPQMTAQQRQIVQIKREKFFTLLILAFAEVEFGNTTRATRYLAAAQAIARDFDGYQALTEAEEEELENCFQAIAPS